MAISATPQQISEFIEANIDSGRTIVGVLRYGAHLLHIAQSIAGPTQPRHLVLSHMLDFFPDDFFAGKQFLVLDDTVYEGRQMRSLKEQLVVRGVLPENIETAAVVVHEQSEFRPDHFLLELKEHDYIAWKEELSALVRTEARPTDRDHPLYYFDVSGLDCGKFVSCLTTFGEVHSVGTGWNEELVPLSLTVHSDVLADLNMPGISIEPVSKARLYWKETNGTVRLTIAPMVFSTINCESRLTHLESKLSEEMGIPETVFSRQENQKARYYYLSRSISALLLVRLLRDLAVLLSTTSGVIAPIRPEVVDANIEYLFPYEYKVFYDAVFENLRTVLSPKKPVPASLALVPNWSAISRPASPSVEALDPLLPHKYDVVEFVTRKAAPSLFDGKRWRPVEGNVARVTHSALLTHFRDPLFLSASLDEFLDSGLLKAEDWAFQPGVFCRTFAPGGEFNAVRVSRIARMLRERSPEMKSSLLEEEAFELWGAD